MENKTFEKYLTLFNKNKDHNLVAEELLNLDTDIASNVLSFLESKLKRIEATKIKSKYQSLKHSRSTTKTEKNTDNKMELDLIHPHPHQPRKIFEESEVLNIANSIYRNGQFHPIVIYIDQEGKAILVVGQLRLESFKYLRETYPDEERFKKIEYKAIDELDPKPSKLLLMAIEENTHRNELNITQTALSYAELLTLLKEEEGADISIRDFADKVNISKSKMHDYLKIAEIKSSQPELFSFIEQNKISSRTAILSVASLECDINEKIKILKEYMDEKITIKEFDASVAPKESTQEVKTEQQKTTNTGFESLFAFKKQFNLKKYNKLEPEKKSLIDKRIKRMLNYSKKRFSKS